MVVLSMDMYRFEAWPIAISLIHFFLLCDGTTDDDFSMHSGYIAGGGDISQEYITVTEAKARCLETSDCRGFTFMGPPSEGPMWINLKSHWDVGGDGWTSYRREIRIESADTTSQVPSEKKLEAPALDVTNAPSVLPEHPESSSGSNPSIEPLEVPATDAAGSDPAPQKPGLAEEPIADAAGNERVSEKPELAEEPIADIARADTLEVVGSGDLPKPESRASVLPDPVAEVMPAEISLKDWQKDGFVRAAVRLRTPPAVEPTNYSKNLFVGKLMAMTQRAVVGLNEDLVVFCYATPEVGGACMAGNATATKIETLPEDSRMLSPVPWGVAEVFNTEETGRLEVVRLTPVRFAVCFERVSDSSVLCSAGAIHGGESAETSRCTFGTSSVVGVGRLISASPYLAGQQLAACFADKLDGRVACRWARIEQEGETFALSWFEEAQVVRTV